MGLFTLLKRTTGFLPMAMSSAAIIAAMAPVKWLGW